MFNEVFGPSIYLLLLDLFLENPNMLANLREVSRMVGKNPGSISRVMPRLVRKGFVDQIRVGKVMYAYRLNKENDIVLLLIHFHRKLEDACNSERERSKRRVKTIDASQ